MTSGNFGVERIADIHVDRENRQRKTLVGIEELADSIRKNGLINPITVTRSLQLIAGERRYEAHKLLGFDHISVQYLEDLSEAEQQIIELEENAKRVDLDWKDRVDAVYRFHHLQKAQNEEWSLTDTGDALGVDRRDVGRWMLVAQQLKDGVKEVMEAPKMSTAVNAAQRKAERAKANILQNLNSDLSAVSGAPAAPKLDTIPAQPLQSEGKSQTEEIPASEPPSRNVDILNLDFHHWAQEVREVPFNFLHCDFPYGVNAGDTIGYSKASTLGKYDDDAKTYFSLLETLTRLQDNFLSPSCHMMFWFSMDYYNETEEIFKAAGWRVDKFPLIWAKSDNAGIMPDPNRGPRRIYETAFFCTRGDRKVVKPISNLSWQPTTKNYHTSEKSYDMLSHFFRMIVDEHSRVLDPTCGSGMALKAAEAAGAQYCLGLEKDAEFAQRAKENLDLG